MKTWLHWVLDGNARERGLAVQRLREEPALFAGDPWLACSIGDLDVIRDMLAREPGWVHRPGGPLGMQPLIAVTHSRLILEDAFAPKLLEAARLLLQHGANANAAWTDTRWPDSPLSALYGAAGRTHHAGMMKLLLDAGADPTDNESLYHSVESRDPTCTLLLLEAGARVTGTNAIGRVLDYDKLDLLRLLLQRGGDAAERPWLHSAIRRGRSHAHVLVLIEAGADLRATNREGISVYRWAQMFGRTDVVAMLQERGVAEALSDEEAFVAACARGDAAAARAIRQRVPDILERLNEEELQALPRLAAIGEQRAVHTMLALDWPREVKAEWDATALNLAIYHGNAAVARLLLEQGADWRTPHGFGGNATGTLSYASLADDIEDPAARDYVGCARALADHGVPLAALRALPVSAPVRAFLESRAAGEDGAG